MEEIEELLVSLKEGSVARDLAKIQIARVLATLGYMGQWCPPGWNPLTGTGTFWLMCVDIAEEVVGIATG